MKQPVNQTGGTQPAQASGLDGRHRDNDGQIRRTRSGFVLGLAAFEKISAVEGVRLSGDMRKDLRSFDTKRMDAKQRSLFIAEKYGKK